MKKIKYKFLRGRTGQRKIQTCVILLVLFCVSPLLAEPCGDVNSDGSIDIVDALLIAQYYVGLDPPNFDESAADVNGDGAIDIVDALVIAQFYVGLIDELPGCTPEPTPPTPVPTESPTPGSVSSEIQAEDGTWNHASVETDHDGYTGTGYVNTVNSTGNWMEWSIDAEDTCNVTCEVRYACGGGARPMELSINGSIKTTLDFPGSGGWAVWTTETAAVILDAGLNVIRLTATGSSGGPNIDKLDLTTDGAMITPVLYKWNPDNINSESWTLNEWTSTDDVIKLDLGSGGVREMISPNMYLNAGIYDTIYVRMRNASTVSHLQIEYRTQEIQSWDQDRIIKIKFKASNNFIDYKIDLNNVSKWSGIVTQFKLSPSESSSTGSIEIESLHITYNTYPDDIIVYWESGLSMNNPDLMAELTAIEIFNYNEDNYPTIQSVIDQDPFTGQDSGFADSAGTDLADLYDAIGFQVLFRNIAQYPVIEVNPGQNHDAGYASCVDFYLEDVIKNLIDRENPDNPEREKEKRQVYWQKLLHTLCGILTRKWIETRPGTIIRDIILTPNARQYGNDNALIDGGTRGFHPPAPGDGPNDFLFGTWKDPNGQLHTNIENVKQPNYQPKKIIKVFILDSVPGTQLQNIHKRFPGNQDLIECVSRIEVHEYNGMNSGRFASLSPELNSENKKIDVPGDLSNHGLFSAGIVYGIARYVDIELIEVLNQKCVGDLFSFMWGFSKIQEILHNESYNDIYVINCSYMFRHPLREFQDDLVYEIIESATGGESYPPLMNPTSHFYRRIFENIHNRSGDMDPMGIICCSSGNNYHTLTSQQTFILNRIEPEIADDCPMAPASFDNTYGIGAFYIKDGQIEPASYSRTPGEGGYWAMGGDFDPLVPGSDLKSQTLLSFYVSNFLPKLNPGDPDIPNEIGWARGTGTSYASAVTSGIFAIYSSIYPDTHTIKVELDNHCKGWSVWNPFILADDERATNVDEILNVVQGAKRDP